VDAIGARGAATRAARAAKRVDNMLMVLLRRKWAVGWWQLSDLVTLMIRSSNEVASPYVARASKRYHVAWHFVASASSIESTNDSGTLQYNDMVYSNILQRNKIASSHIKHSVRKFSVHSFVFCLYSCHL